ESQRLARAAGLPLHDFGEIINPYSYSSYFARSAKCTFAKMTSVDYGRTAEVAEVVAQVKVYATVRFEHRVLPAAFQLHLLFGSIEIERSGSARAYSAPCLVTVPPGPPLMLRASAGAWFAYVSHPLSLWIRERGRPD